MSVASSSNKSSSHRSHQGSTGSHGKNTHGGNNQLNKHQENNNDHDHDHENDDKDKDDDDDNDNDNDNESVHSTTTTSTHDSNSVASSIDDVKLKLFQMKRANNKKAPQSKLLMKFKNFITPEQRLKNELNKRIELGVRSCLMYHTPVELSSICGVLQLKPLQRANVSIDLIIKYCKGSDDDYDEGNKGKKKGKNNHDDDGDGLYGHDSRGEDDPNRDDFNENKVLKVVNNMWEGALFEYLKSIGHPMTTLQDPKQTLMKIWRYGGFHELNSAGGGGGGGGGGSLGRIGTFTPHYIQKRILTRYDQDQSPDIQNKLIKLKACEQQVKYYERELFEEHNYNNALVFFQQIGEIRRLETEFRDYLIHELESNRTNISRAQSNMELAHDMVHEIEERYLQGVEQLNTQLSIQEVCYENEIVNKFQLIQQMASLDEVIQSISNISKQENALLLSSLSPTPCPSTSVSASLSSPTPPLSQPPLSSSSVSLSDIAKRYQLYLRSGQSKWKTFTSENLQKLNQHLQNIYHAVTANQWRDRQRTENMTRVVSAQDTKIQELSKKIQELKKKLVIKNKQIVNLQTQVTQRDEEIRIAARDVCHLQVLHDGTRREAWKMAVRNIGKINSLEEKLHSIEGILKSAIQLSNNPLLISFCRGINNILSIVPTQTMEELYELGVMREEDHQSELRRQEEMRITLLSSASKTKKKKKKGTTGGGAKKKGTGGKKSATSGKKSTTSSTSGGGNKTKKTTTGAASTSGSKTSATKKTGSGTKQVAKKKK